MGRPRSQGKRKSILESAFRVFGECGYQRSTMRMIAERAGMVPGALYIYFPSKEILFEAAVREGWDRFLSDLHRAAVSSRPFRERIREVLDLGFSRLKDGLPLLQGMLFEANQRRLFQDRLDALCASLEQLFAAGWREGQLEAPADPGRWKTVIRLNTVGALFSAALAAPGRVDREIAELKAAIQRQLADRLRGAPA